MTVRIFVGDCRAILKSMAPESVHCCVTSPPYYGLRDYKGSQDVWGGDPACDHDFADAIRKPGGSGFQGKNGQRAGRSSIVEQETIRNGGNFCVRCGAWRGSLGLEPDWRMYVEHLVEIFREVRRVLRRDGTVWLNLGDSFATGAGAVRDFPGGGAQGDAWAGRAAPGATSRAGRGARHGSPRHGSAAGKQEYTGLGPMTQPNRMPQPGFKPKDLMLIPARVAIALQEDGWWVRNDIIWKKDRPLPESVTDRCTKSHEHIFLLARSEHYFFDAEAIAEPVTEVTIRRMIQPSYDRQIGSDRVPGKTNGHLKAVVKRSGNKGRRAASDRGVPGGAGKNQASSVPWEGMTRNKRDVWTVNPQAFVGEFCLACRTFFEGDDLNALRVEEGGGKKRLRYCACGETDRWLSHFASFPSALIEPCIKAGASEKGCCVRCSAPFEREIEKKATGRLRSRGDGGLGTAESRAPHNLKPVDGNFQENVVRETVGWTPTCGCAHPFSGDGNLGRPLILDPFSGTGTSAMVADRLHYDAVLIEKNPDYAEMARQRVAMDAGPMFGDVRIIAAPAREAAE